MQKLYKDEGETIRKYELEETISIPGDKYRR